MIGLWGFILAKRVCLLAETAVIDEDAILGLGRLSIGYKQQNGDLGGMGVII